MRGGDGEIGLREFAEEEGVSEKVLFIDDSRNVLDTYKRQFRKQFEVETALGPEWGMEKLTTDGPFAVVISDYRMPNMDGVEFLLHVKDAMPEASRILITGYADVSTALRAVNEGSVFRFLTKPCTHEALNEAVAAGLEHHRLLRSERDILEQTLNGCLKTITEVFSLAHPDAFGRMSRVQRYLHGMVRPMGMTETWRLETAAMLSQIGTMTLPEDLVRKHFHGEALTEKEQQLFDKHPYIGAELLATIPRLGDIAEIIRYQEKRFDGSGPPHDAKKGREIPVEARMLKVVLDFDVLESGGLDRDEAFQQLSRRVGWYDPVILETLRASFEKEKRYKVSDVTLEELTEEMILADGVRDERGRMIVSKGQQVTPGLLMHLMHIAHQKTIQEPIKVIVPIALDS